MSEAPVPAQVAGTPLQLRYDDPIALMPFIKVLLITALLLAVVYVVLRWYARRGGAGTTGDNTRPELQCAAALRLSPRTKVYLVKTPTAQLLITETATGSTVTSLPAAAIAPAGPVDQP